MREASRIYRHEASKGMERDSGSGSRSRLRRGQGRARISGAPSRQRRKRPGTNVFGRSAGGYRQQQAKILIERDERRGASIIGLEPDADRFWPVILALEELAATAIARACDLWRSFGRMEHRLARCAGAPSAQPRNDGTHGQFVVDDRRKREALIAHQLSQ